MTLDSGLIVALSTAVMSSVVGPIAVHYVKYFFEKRKKQQETFKDAIKDNQLITEKIEHIRENFSADRVWLLQFHNGGHFYPTGKSIQKFSMVYEVLKDGVLPCQNQFQNIPVSLFNKAINYLSKKENIIIPDVELNKYGAFTTVVSGASVRSTYVFPIFNIKEEFVGIVGVDFAKNPMSLSEDEVGILEVEVSVIGGVLNNFLKNA